MREFARTQFTDTAYFSFETSGELRRIFDRNLDVFRILRELGDFRHRKINPTETIIIFDEIQECPAAITALKSFFENLPELAILCAGSLLGLTPVSPASFPVGKVSLITMYPMDFTEFLHANGQTYLAESLRNVSSPDMLSPVLCEEFSDWYRDYLLVGGMPEAVSVWIEHRSLAEVDEVLDDILQMYGYDFAKHAPGFHYPKLAAVWNSVPVQLLRENRKFVYSEVMSGGRARTLSDAVAWLNSAGLIHTVYLAEQPKIPLSSAASLSSFKIYMCDVGLLRKLGRIPPEEICSVNQVSDLMRGAIAENFVCTELAANGMGIPYYWRSGNRAELEFLMPIGNLPVPIEVKSGRRTTGKSLTVYREKYHPLCAVRISRKYAGRVSGEYGTLISLPLFAVSALDRTVRRLMQ